MKQPVLLCILGIFLAGAFTAKAQLQATAIGAKVGFYFDGYAMLGVMGEIPLTPELSIEPALENVFGIPNTTLLVLDVNGRYTFSFVGSDVKPFALAGLGLGFSNVSTTLQSASDTRLRFNVGGGFVFNTRSLIQPWAGLKIFFSNGNDVAVQGGVNWYAF